MANEMTRQQLTDSKDTARFVLGGNATFTLVSEKTNARYTYRVRTSDDGKLWFVSYLTGANNETDYSYVGIIRANNGNAPMLTLNLTKKSQLTDDSLPVRAFRYMLAALLKTAMPVNVQVWHEGRCGRCGRTLTVPSSIAVGIGPECQLRMMAAA
jgi:hypothetical protein